MPPRPSQVPPPTTRASQVSQRGFYGDQTALTVALGRSDVDVRWLDPKFNVMVNCPTHYVHSTCGPDALYSRAAVAFNASSDGGGAAAAAQTYGPLSIVHFVWGPKPWMKQLDGKPPRSVYPAVQADIPLANAYRTWVRALLGEARVAKYFLPGAMDQLDPVPTSPFANRASYDACDTGHRTPPRPLHPCRPPPLPP